MRIGLTYDLRDDYLAMGFSEEDTAEFDRESTIEGIEGALRRLGHETDRIGHLKALLKRLSQGDRWDLVFNICEGMYGIGREAQVPAVLDAHSQPYVFSDPLVLALTLHKGMTKRVVRDAGIPTPEFLVVETAADLDVYRTAAPDDVDSPAWGRIPRALRLPTPDRPLFAKPVAEGTGKGVTGKSIIRSRDDLVSSCSDLLERFRQPVLLEDYLSGREFTVGVVGTGDRAESVGVMEVILNAKAEKGVYSYTNKEYCDSLVEYRIASDPEGRLAEKCALDSWRVLGCRDGGRVDVRSDRNGVPSFIEVNPLAGLHPVHSDLPIICNLQGYPYDKLIERIVASAATRIDATRALPAASTGPAASPGTRQRRQSARSRAAGKPLVVILHNDVPPDAPLDEQDNLAEAEALRCAMEDLGYRAQKLPFTLDMQAVARRIRSANPRCVFNIVESVEGRGRLIYLACALLDHLGVRYTGARTDAMFCTSNKLVGKEIMAASGVPTARFATLADALAGRASLGMPCIVKSVWEHASVGLDETSIISDASMLATEMLRRRGSLGGECFAEEFIDGREFNLAVIGGPNGPEILPPGEILFQGFHPEKPRMVSYAAKWVEGSFDYENTPRRFDIPSQDAALIERLKAISHDCWRAFGLTGYARVDFRVDREERPFVLEVNANPCISPDSGFSAMVREGGLEYHEFVQRMIEDCLHGM